MRDRLSLRAPSFLLGAVVLLLGLVLLGGGTAPTAPSDAGATEALVNPDDIVNIAGRRHRDVGGVPPPGTVYTVPAGKNLVIRGFMFSSSETYTTGELPLVNIFCDENILVPREVVGVVGGWDPSEVDNLGWVCGPGSQVKVGGPNVSGTDFGWMIVGELVTVTP